MNGSRKAGIRIWFITNKFVSHPAGVEAPAAHDGYRRGRRAFLHIGHGHRPFIEYQKPDGSAYVIGGRGLIEELERHNIRITRDRPDYVIVGETDEYDYSRIMEATLLIQEGARFIATNPDITGPTPRGPVPACGALVALSSG